MTFKNIMCFDGDAFKKCNIEVGEGYARTDISENTCESDNDLYLLPGFVDVHVHFREPGFSYKETIQTGSMAAAAGGYTEVCTMPNLNPAPDCSEHLAVQEDIIRQTAVIGVHPYGTITKGQQGKELADFEDLSTRVAGFSDDGKGVQDDLLMKKAMLEAKRLDKIIVAHCEVNELLKGGYIHLGEYAKTNNHRGICSESEYKQIERDIELVRETGVKYHVCRISTAESVEIIRKAKAEGLDVTCETGPHYLVMSDSDLQDDGRFKMNPPIRSERDKNALIEGIIDGTIDMIATDHAPHSADEKALGLEGSAMGIVGLETAFPVLYTKLVKPGIITLEKLIDLLHFNPKKCFNIETSVEAGSFTIFDLNEKFTVDSSKFKSKGKATPFEGLELYGKCKYTFYKGKQVFKED